VKAGAGVDHFALLEEGEAASGEGVVEVFEGLEALIGKRLVDEGAEIFCGLQFRAVRRLKSQAKAVGTVRFSGPCQPALSSCRMIRLSVPAPADFAKSASTSFSRC